VAAFHCANSREWRRKPGMRHVIFPNETHADLLRFRQEWLDIGDAVKFNHVYFPTPPTAEIRDTKRRDIRREPYIYWNGKVPLCGCQYLYRTAEFLDDIRGNVYRRNLESSEACAGKRISSQAQPRFGSILHSLHVQVIASDLMESALVSRVV
jgi:hypothetical protein